MISAIEEFMKTAKGTRIVAPYISVRKRKLRWNSEDYNASIYIGLELSDGQKRYSKYMECSGEFPYSFSSKLEKLKKENIEKAEEMARRFVKYWERETPDERFILRNLKKIPFLEGNMAMARSKKFVKDIMSDRTLG